MSNTCIKCGKPDPAGFCDKCCREFCREFIEDHKYGVGWGPQHDVNQAFLRVAEHIVESEDTP